MSIVFCGFAPHPPIAVPEVGKGRDREIEDTQQSMLTLGERIIDKTPDVLVMITPHGPVFSDAIGVYDFEELNGDLGMFGASSVSYTEKNHPLGQAILDNADQLGVPVVKVDSGIMKRAGMDNILDHGITVPLYFLKKAGVDVPMVVISMGLLQYDELYRFGVAIQQAANSMDVRVALVASGDLSHRLTPDAPAGYDPAGIDFDKKIVELVGKGDVNGIINLDPELVEKAGECGLRPLIMAMGAVDGLQLEPQVLSYQGPFGVGYMVADMKPGQQAPERQFLSSIEKGGNVKSKERESSLVRLAREALEKYVQGNFDRKDINIPEELVGEKAGAFVSIKKQGQLRGCIGTIEAVRENLGEEIIENAISAGTRDPRFNPVTPDELDSLEYHVDVLGEPEPVKSLDELDPKNYGVIVRSGPRKGLLLPDLEGIDTAEEQVSIAMQKAGISPGEEIEVERFKVERYT